MSAKNKVFNKLTAAYITRDATGTFGNTTLTTAAAVGANTISVASITNFANAKLIRIGSGEQMELATVSGAPAGGVITLGEPLTKAHDAGEAVVEQIPYDLGDFTEAGVSVNFNGSVTDVLSAMRRLAFTTLQGYVDARAEFALPTLDLGSLAVALGIPFTAITGAGTSAAWKAFATDGSAIASEANQGLIALGVTMDGSIIRAELWGCDVDYAGLQLPMSRGQLTSVPVKLVAGGGGVFANTVAAWAGNISQRPGKGKTFDALSDVGTIAAIGGGGAAATTSTGTAAAGARVIAAAAVAGFTGNDWVLIGSGDTVEAHQVESIASLNLNLRTPLLRAQGAGTAIVRAQPVSLGNIAESGVTLGVNGSSTQIRMATRRLTIGLKPGDASVQLGVNLIDYTLSSIARALGIPQSAISGNRLAVGNNIGTGTIDALYLRGTLQSGETIWIIAYGCQQLAQNVAVALASAGVTALPMTVKPTSGVLFAHAA